MLPFVSKFITVKTIRKQTDTKVNTERGQLLPKQIQISVNDANRLK